MPCILLVGADEMLLQTRAEVLRKTGSEVISSNAASAFATQTDRECDLVILCHSLSGGQSASLAEVIHERWPKTRILLVRTQRDWLDSEVAAAVDGVSSPEPGHLVETTIELLRKPVGADAGYVDVRGGIARGGPFAS